MWNSLDGEIGHAKERHSAQTEASLSSGVVETEHVDRSWLAAEQVEDIGEGTSGNGCVVAGSSQDDAKKERFHYNVIWRC